MPTAAIPTTRMIMMAMTLRSLLYLAISCAVFLEPWFWLPGQIVGEYSQQAYAMTPLSTLSFRDRVMVSGKRVNVLDLCEAEKLPEDWQVHLAGIDIGAAPEGNAVKTINMDNMRIYVRQLLESQGLNPDKVEVRLPDRINIERRRQIISKGQIEEIVRQHIQKTTSTKSEDVHVEAVGMGDPLVVPDGALSWEIQNPLHDQASGTTALTIQFYVNGTGSLSSRVVSKVQVVQKVVCAARNMKRDEIIGSGDLKFLRINIAHHPERFLTDFEQVVGKRLTADVTTNQPVDTEALDKAVTVKRGSTVIVVYNRDGLNLTAKGQAKEDGTLGDTVKVINMDSKRAMLCRVLDPHTVEVVP
ncbi:MAG TPA: flagella basal body P-ring formation protein FlgA [Syntrophobacteraceae bacterium]|nr:flagella basal body P-ring formation protein FlgA [Syntrophobacteraceae bacterium]